MHRYIYSLFFYLALPIIFVRLLIRSLRSPAYRRRWGERLAFQSPPSNFDNSKPTIWIHAVSVGETVASAPLVEELGQRYPGAQIVVTTMTPTGSDRVCSLFGDKAFHCYVPYDLPGACSRFIAKYQPALLILMETELWPNLIHSCHRNNVKIVLANARLSEKSAAGYRRFATFTRSVLQQIDCIAAQASLDAERFEDLGAEPTRIRVTGSLKFIIDVQERQAQPYFEKLKTLARPILIAASTRDGEEEKVLQAFRIALQTASSLLLILIPRHPERFDKVLKLSRDSGLETSKRSDGLDIESNVQVLIGDSMGEMLDYYSVAEIAFVGGSLVDTGCQNVLEPAALGIPVLVGPSQFNFATICKQLEQVQALKTVQDSTALGESISRLLLDKDAQSEMGEQGRRLIAENQNSLPALMDLLELFIQTDA